VVSNRDHDCFPEAGSAGLWLASPRGGAQNETMHALSIHDVKIRGM
jgi:hypothetical protein